MHGILKLIGRGEKCKIWKERCFGLWTNMGYLQKGMGNFEKNWINIQEIWIKSFNNEL